MILHAFTRFDVLSCVVIEFIFVFVMFLYFSIHFVLFFEFAKEDFPLPTNIWPICFLAPYISGSDAASIRVQLNIGQKKTDEPYVVDYPLQYSLRTRNICVTFKSADSYRTIFTIK